MNKCMNQPITSNGLLNGKQYCIYLMDLSVKVDSSRVHGLRFMFIQYHRTDLVIIRVVPDILHMSILKHRASQMISIKTTHIHSDMHRDNRI